MAKVRPSKVTGFKKEDRNNKRRTYEQNVQRSEDTIRNEYNEYMIMLNDDGTIRFKTTDGERSTVGLSPEMKANVTDSVMSHNHPGGSSFSPEDIAVAMYYQLREIRATTAMNGTFVLHRTHQTGVFPKTDYAMLPQLFRDARVDIHAEIQAGIYNGTISFANVLNEENQRVARWLTDNAPRFGWEFRWER